MLDLSLNINLEKLKGSVLLYLLCLYPFYCYFVIDKLGDEPDDFLNFLLILFTADLLIRRYIHNQPLYVPLYLKLLGLFFLYKLFSVLFLTDQFENRGIIRIVLYDKFLGAILAFLVVENTRFTMQQLRTAVYILLVMVLISAIVIMVQVVDPLFFVNVERLFEGIPNASLSKLRVIAQTEPHLLDHFARLVLFQGYKFSIYSWVDNKSIGIDFISIFSLLYALKYLSNRTKGVVVVLAGITSLLCYSRYVMLSFVIISASPFLISGRWGVLVKYGFAMVFGLIVFYYAAPFMGIDIDKAIEERLLSDSAGTRLYAFEMFGQIFPLRPIFGTAGVQTEDMLRLAHGVTSQIHVGWLSLFYWFGIVGGSLWCFFYFSLLFELRSRAIKTKFWGSFFAVLIFALVNISAPAVDVYQFGTILAIIFSTRGHLIFKPDDLPDQAELA